MSMGGDETTQTSSTAVDMPGWIKRPLQGLVSDATALSQQEYPTYEGDRLAALSPEEQRAYQLSSQMVGQAPDQIAKSQDISAEVARRGLEGFSQAELDPYMNPYTQNVLDVQRGRAFDQYSQLQRDMGQRAGEAGAFGGSRFGLQEAQMSDQFQRQLAESETMGLSQAYDRGLAGAFQGSQMAGMAGMDMANLAGARQQAQMQDIGALSQAGMAQRGYEQTGLDLGYEQFLKEQAFPYEQQQYLQSILNPAGQMMRGSTTTDVTKTDSSFGLSDAIGIASLVAAPFTGGLSGMLGTGLGSALGGMGMAGLGSALSMGMGGAEIMGGAGGLAPSAAGFSPGRKPLNQGGRVQGYNKGGSVSAENGYNHGGEMMNPEGITRDQWMEYQNRLHAPPVPQRKPTTLKEVNDFIDNHPAVKQGKEPLTRITLDDLDKSGLSVDELAQLVQMELNAAGDESTGLGFNKGGSTFLDRIMSKDLIGGAALEDTFLAKPYFGLGSLGSAAQKITEPLGKAIYENPLEAAGIGLAGVPVVGPLAGIGLKGAAKAPSLIKGLTGAAKAHPRATAGLAGLGILGAGAAQDKRSLKAKHADENRQLEEHYASKEQAAPKEVQDPSQGLIDLVTKQMGGAKQQQTALVEDKKDKKGGINMPLVAFGAALLQSKGDFYQALGEGASAYAGTSMSLKDREKEFAQQQAKAAMDERRLQAYEQQVQSSNNPFKQQMDQLKIQKMEKDLANDPALQKRLDTNIQSLIKMGEDPSTVLQKAMTLTMQSNLSGTGAPQQQPAGGAGWGIRRK